MRSSEKTKGNETLECAIQYAQDGSYSPELTKERSDTCVGVYVPRKFLDCAEHIHTITKGKWIRKF